MAIVFHKNVRNNYLRNTFAVALSGETASATPAVFNVGLTIYGGTQPTAADFIANWTASYKFTYLVNFTTTIVLDQPNAVTTNLGITIANSGLPTAVAATNSGTATWAIIWDTARVPSSITSVSGVKWLIVPISDTSGTAPLRMANTTIVAPNTYTFSDFSLTAAGGIA